VDKSGFVDEEEFTELLSTVLAGRIRGIGGGIDFYRRPYQHMQWEDLDFHPATDWQDLFFGTIRHFVGSLQAQKLIFFNQNPDLLFAGGAFCGAALLSESLVNGQEVEGFFWWDNSVNLRAVYESSV
jgi:hypothetical protein